MTQNIFDQVIQRRGLDGEKWNRYPEDVLPMWIADSDFKTPQEIITALAKRVEQGAFGYTNFDNSPFCKAAQRWMSVRFGWTIDPDWVVLTPGVRAGLALSVITFTAPDDNVVMLTPVYPPFYSIVRDNGRNPVSSPLICSNGKYEIDFADLERKLSDPKARMLLLCNPHNPTGRVFTKNELLRIGDLCLKHNILVMSDEIHCDYVFEGHKHIPFPSLGQDYADISLVAINPSKTFNIADLHTGAMISANPILLNRYKAAVTSANWGSHSFGLIAFITAYTQCDYYADAVNSYTYANLKHAVDFINTHIPKINAYLPESTYLLWLDCSEMGFGTQHELENFFLDKAKLALNSGIDYGIEGKQFMRINLACPRSIVEEALNRLENAVNIL